jgi:hypothetical protein
LGPAISILDGGGAAREPAAPNGAADPKR